MEIAASRVASWISGQLGSAGRIEERNDVESHAKACETFPVPSSGLSRDPSPAFSSRGS